MKIANGLVIYVVVIKQNLRAFLDISDRPTWDKRALHKVSMYHTISFYSSTESPVTAVPPSLVFGELSVEVPSSTAAMNLVTTVKETITSPSYSRLIAELEKQYVAITPPDSPEPQGLVC